MISRVICSWKPDAQLLKTASQLIVRVPLGGLSPKNYALTTRIEEDELIVFFTEISSSASKDGSLESKTERLRQEARTTSTPKDRELS